MAPVCSLGGGPPAVLAGALADRLLVMRGDQGTDAGGCKVSARQVALLPSLLLGWASLAACSILPGEVSRPPWSLKCLANTPLSHLCWGTSQWVTGFVPHSLTTRERTGVI